MSECGHEPRVALTPPLPARAMQQQPVAVQPQYVQQAQPVQYAQPQAVQYAQPQPVQYAQPQVVQYAQPQVVMQQPVRCAVRAAGARVLAEGCEWVLCAL